MDIIEDTKIIFIDIDGTLTNSNKEITQKTSDIIKKITQKDILVILCSGRSNPYTIEKSKNANASSIVICNGGNLIFDYKNQKILYINEIKENDLKNFFEYCNYLKLDCVFNGVKMKYKNKHSKKTGILIENTDDIKEPISQININCYNFKEAMLFKEYLDNSPIFESSYVSKSVLLKENNAEKYKFDVIYKKCSKGTGIKKLLEYLNIPVSQTMCFGDYVNDFSMFKECDITVAMGNAIEELKKIADYITTSNNNDGVAKFLEDKLL